MCLFFCPIAFPGLVSPHGDDRSVLYRRAARPAHRLRRCRARAAHCTLVLPFPSCSCGKGAFKSQNLRWRSWNQCVIFHCATQGSCYLRLLCRDARRRLGLSNLLLFVAETYSLLSTIMLLVQISLPRIFPSLVLN